MPVNNDAILPHFTRRDIVQNVQGDRFYLSLTALLQPLHRLISPLGSNKEKRKRVLVIGSALLLIPILVVFVIQDILQPHRLGLVMDGGTLLVFSISLGFLLKIRNGTWIYRLMTFAVTILLAYNIVIGPNGDNSLMWALTYPAIVFFIVGFPEGLLWFACILLVCFATFTFPQTLGTYSYQLETRIVFGVLFFIFTGLSIGFEALRWYFCTTLEKHQTELMEALENIRTLRGLLPICSVCKKIRDDHGYWNQLETYLSMHTDAKFSHGMCDDCFREQYPDIYAKRNGQIGEKSTPKQTGDY